MYHMHMFIIWSEQDIATDMTFFHENKKNRAHLHTVANVEGFFSLNCYILPKILLEDIWLVKSAFFSRSSLPPLIACGFIYFGLRCWWKKTQIADKSFLGAILFASFCLSFVWRGTTKKLSRNWNVFAQTLWANYNATDGKLSRNLSYTKWFMKKPVQP